MLGRTLFLTQIGMTIACLLTKTSWFYHLLPAIASGFLLMCYCLLQLIARCVELGMKNFLWRSTLLLGLFFGLVFSPLAILHIKYTEARAFRYIGDQLIIFLQKNATGKIACLPGGISSFCFPMIEYAGKQFIGRQSNFWWMGGVMKAPKNKQTQEDATYLVNIIAKDIDKGKPQLLVVDQYMINLLSNEDKRSWVFTSNENLRYAWKHYKFKAYVPAQEQAWHVYERVD